MSECCGNRSRDIKSKGEVTASSVGFTSIGRRGTQGRWGVVQPDAANMPRVWPTILQSRSCGKCQIFPNPVWACRVTTDSKSELQPRVRFFRSPRVQGGPSRPARIGPHPPPPYRRFDSPEVAGRYVRSKPVGRFDGAAAAVAVDLQMIPED